MQGSKTFLGAMVLDNQGKSSSLKSQWAGRSRFDMSLRKSGESLSDCTI